MPELCQNNVPRKQRAQGKRDALRTRSLACESKKTHELVTTGVPKRSGLPCANGFNGFLRTLSGDRALLPPSPRNAKHCRELISASGYRDHTTSPSAQNPARPAGRRRPPHPAPNVRDDRETPLLRSAGCESGYSCFYPAVKVNSENPKLEPSGIAGTPAAL